MHGWVPCCFTSLSVNWPMLFIFLTQRCAQMDPRSIPHNPKQLETLYRARGWPGCPATVCHQDLAGTEVLICVWAKDIIWLVEHCTWKLTPANELHDLYQWNCVLSFTWQDFPSLGYWEFSIFLFYWKSDLSRSLWQWIFLFRPRLRLPLTSSWPEELSRRGLGGLCLSTGPEVWWLPMVPPSTHAHSGCIKRIVFLLISTQAHPETMWSSPAATSAAELARLPALFQSLVTCPESSQNLLGYEQGFDTIFSYLILRTCRCASSPASNYLNLWSEVWSFSLNPLSICEGI